MGSGRRWKQGPPQGGSVAGQMQKAFHRPPHRSHDQAPCPHPLPQNPEGWRTLTVSKLDRPARSLCNLITMIEDFDKRGIHFRSLTEEINTATPGGKLIFHIFGALAEFERGLIIERTREGMKAARARGVRSGPKPKLSRQQIEHARKLIEEGQRHEATAALFNVSRVTLCRALLKAS